MPYLLKSFQEKEEFPLFVVRYLRFASPLSELGCEACFFFLDRNHVGLIRFAVFGPVIVLEIIAN